MNRTMYHQAARRLFAGALLVLSSPLATVDAPRFRVTARFEQEREAMLGWDFHLRLRGNDLVIRGVTHLRFDATGRVVLNIQIRPDGWVNAVNVVDSLDPDLSSCLMRIVDVSRFPESQRGATIAYPLEL